MARLGVARTGKAGLGLARQGLAWLGKVWRGGARHGWRGKARLIEEHRFVVKMKQAKGTHMQTAIQQLTLGDFRSWLDSRDEKEVGLCRNPFHCIIAHYLCDRLEMVRGRLMVEAGSTAWFVYDTQTDQYVLLPSWMTCIAEAFDASGVTGQPLFKRDLHYVLMEVDPPLVTLDEDIPF